MLVVNARRLNSCFRSKSDSAHQIISSFYTRNTILPFQRKILYRYSQPSTPLARALSLSSIVETAITRIAPMIDLSTLTITLTAAYILLKFITFTKAYADLTLLSRPKLPPNAYSGKVVWIIGASQGLGEALALEWASHGAKLILSSRSLDKLESVKASCMMRYDISDSDIILLPLDLVGPPDAIAAAAQAAFSSFDNHGVDYVVHNAGASQHAPSETTSAAVAAQLIDLNLIGPITATQATLPMMLARGSGHHIVVASMSAIVPSPGQAVYAAAKSGIRAYFASVASELADKNIKVSICCPGPLEAGENAKPRYIYGPDGLIQQASTGMSNKRVAITLAAQLIASAGYYKLDECWIAYHPVLLIGYIMQYMPNLGRKVLKKIGPGRVRLMKEGKGAYDVRGMLSK